MPEYSVLYPHINSLSASGRSNGQRLSSASIHINIIKKPKKHGRINQPKIPFLEYCARVIDVRFIEDAKTTIARTENVIGIS